MSPHRLPIACALLALGACKKDPPPPAADDPKATQARECERFATDTASTVTLTGQLLVSALDEDPVGSSAQDGRDEVRAVGQKLRRELYDKCLTWPEEVMRCLPPFGVLKDGCEERLLAAMDGAQPVPDELPPGPAPTWTFTLESEPRRMQVASDGTVVVIAGVESDALVGLRAGKVAWRREGDHARWMVPVPAVADTWAAAEEHRVIAFDPTSGEERWTAGLPSRIDEGEGYADEHPWVRVAAPTADGLLVGDAEARFFELVAAACGATPHAADAPGCVVARGRLVDELLDSDARLFVGPGGRRYLWEDQTLRGFDSDWGVTMTVQAHDTLDFVALDGDGLRLLIDDDVVDLAPAACDGSAPFAPSGWPQPGALVWRDGDECGDCEAPPPGCRRARRFVPEADDDGPVLLADGTFVLHDDEHTLAVRDGELRWKSRTGGLGPMVTDGTRVFGIMVGREDGDPLRLFEISGQDGTVRWQSPLAARDEEPAYGDEIGIALGSGWIAVAYAQRVLVFALPEA